MQYKVFGCKVNKYYTDRWLNSEYLHDKSGTFVASCVVTDSAKRKWIRFVKKELQNISGTEKIYISWCGAFKDGKAQNDFFTLYPDLAVSKDKIEILDEAPLEDQWKASLRKEEEKKDIHKIDLSRLKNAQRKQIYTKKFILIQGWCDSFCTFCLTVQKRGRHYFRSAEDIAEEIREFENQWGKEVVLTWVNLSAWGLKNTHDIENFSSDVIKEGKKWWNTSRFAELLNYLLENTSIPRIRISSLWPEFITDQVLKIFEQERIYPHFHYSIQSGSSNVLKNMSRHYDGEYMKKLLKKTKDIKRIDDVSISIWADIIVGFPWESDEDFQETYAMVKDYQITKLHAFPFSAHTMWESVPAWKFKDQVDQKVKKQRLDSLLELGEQNRQDFIQTQIWKPLKVLIEKTSWDNWSWWSENYIECHEKNFEIIWGDKKKNGIVVGKITRI